jgi:hypothetical protein
MKEMHELCDIMGEPIWLGGGGGGNILDRDININTAFHSRREVVCDAGCMCDDGRSGRETDAFVE